MKKLSLKILLITVAAPLFFSVFYIALSPLSFGITDEGGAASEKLGPGGNFKLATLETVDAGMPVSEITGGETAIQATPRGRIVRSAEEVKKQEISLQQRLEQRGSFKFIEEDLKIVLRSLAKAYGFNVTLAPDVKGTVTVDFRDVKVINALNTILKDRGLGYQVSGNIVRVTTLEKLEAEAQMDASREKVEAAKAMEEAKKRKAEEEAEPLEIKIFQLKYIDASDAKEAILPILSPERGKAMVVTTRQFTGFQFEVVETLAQAEEMEKTEEYVRSRTLIVQDTPTVLARISQVIEKIDREPSQILIDAKILEVPVDQEFRLGVNWTEALNRWKVGASDLKAIFARGYSREDQTVDSRTREWGDKYENTAQVYDRQQNRRGFTDGELNYAGAAYPASGEKEIEIPGIIDFTIPENEAGGIYQESFIWGAGVQDAVRTYGYDSGETRTILNNYVNSVASTLTNLATSSQVYSAILKAADFNLMLSAMKTDSNIVWLSNPRIIVHENYAAQIFIGERYPILKTEFTAEGGASAGAVGGTSIDEWREIGITLKVIPQIRSSEDSGGKRKINMIVHPAVSNRAGYAEAVSPTGQLYSSSYPIIDLREADTNVTISDGDTVVIGGLITSRTVDEEDKIPLLGDIPILGYLFKEKHTQLKKMNLLIFVTAKIIDETMELSAYEKIMLEKAPPDALEDVRYVRDENLRPYLYRGSERPLPRPDEPKEKKEKIKSRGRKITKAMRRRDDVQ